MVRRLGFSLVARQNKIAFTFTPSACFEGESRNLHYSQPPIRVYDDIKGIPANYTDVCLKLFSFFGFFFQLHALQAIYNTAARRPVAAAPRLHVSHHIGHVPVPGAPTIVLEYQSHGLAVLLAGSIFRARSSTPALHNKTKSTPRTKSQPTETSQTHTASRSNHKSPQTHGKSRFHRVSP